ncbi:hypothetical protein GCM10007981_11140 [Thermocladium modestius]|uniref:5-deoxy-glucuronate isomerase n=1 Tax=Thermocladium modestius TaxID=62609 RepID=A0A830GVH7_9CREN|nr:5-deoxy-glucuronate isomerase [Thermocladium modestius]GGP20960.1 hypothetical protein GCM10007981_11140 [Thermocladium modestius]
MQSISTNREVTVHMKAEGNERLIFPLKGSVKAKDVVLNELDMLYVPRNHELGLDVSPGSVVYIASAAASADKEMFVRRFSEGKRLTVGFPPYKRDVITMIGEEDPVCSFLAGYDEGEPGNWTSYPPHRHDGKPEAYIFYGMGNSFGVQLILTEEDEQAYVVHDYDVVLIPRGYHPNVGTTLNGIKYAWVIAVPPSMKRDLSVMIQPEFKNVPMGQSHLKT